MKEVHAYPLAWPTGWKRTPAENRKGGKFFRAEKVYTETSSRTKTYQMTVEVARKRLIAELDRMGIPDYQVILSTDIPLRKDGFQRSDYEPANPGAAVYWRDRNEQRVMAIDLYDRVADNIAALAATIEAMRAIERHGGAVILDRAFSGFAALPAPVTGQKPWREVLGVGPAESGPKVIELAYRRKRGEAHPDNLETGSHEAFLAVQAAYEQAARELGFTV